MIEGRMKGGPELLDLLDKVPRRYGRNSVRGGMRAGAKVVQIEAKNLVRKRSGRLAKSLKLSSRMDGDIISAKVSAKGPGSFTAPWIEYGVKPHWIVVAGEELDVVRSRVKTRKQASVKTRMGDLNRMERAGSLVINGNFVGPYVHHPGFAAMPFMRPALENKASEALNAAGEYIASRLTWGGLQSPTLEMVEADE